MKPSEHSNRHPKNLLLPPAETKPVLACPYCHSRDLIKKGKRRKKLEIIQLYFCRRCGRKFTPLITKHRTYPLQVILDSLTLYNRFYSLSETADLIFGTYGLSVTGQTIANWTRDFKGYLPVLRLRPTIENNYDKRRIFIASRLHHGQVYDFRCHCAKLDLLLSRHPAHRNFRPLRNFLESVPKECPHALFRENAKSPKRSSRHQDIFNLDQVKITPKPHNTATKSAKLLLQAVGNNKLRHEKLQEFMLANDSVTVAVEVPVVLSGKDVRHFQKQLRFQVPLKLKGQEAVTGHIDIVQIRNGLIHILDYKPGAKREKPIEQLTLYALALSRLTGLRLFHFKCAWFDENDYFEFFPLHVVYKKHFRGSSGKSYPSR